MEKTLPRPRFTEDYKPKPSNLAAGRYGTKEMVDIWGDEKTFEYGLKVQGQAALTLSSLYPDIIPPECANEIYEKASLKYINPNRIREIEEETGHDIIALNKSLEEKVSKDAGTHINKGKTSADTTQPTKAIQLKESLEVIVDSIENLRDILIEKSLEWINIPHMDQTHLYDALPTVAGRPLSHYAEMLQSNLKFMKFVYKNSIFGKWADATGNHHSATALKIDGMKLQEEYCKTLGINFMDAPAQVPGLEFEADITYAMARTGETLNNIARYFEQGRGDDRNIFVNSNPKRKKGSSAMPHKDSKNGNPTAEEQTMSVRNYLMGLSVTGLSNCQMYYGRDLSASANMRINFEDGFKFLDHGIRRLANITYWIALNEEISKERVLRSFGCPTAQQVMTYLTDQRRTKNPMIRSEAHNLTAQLATEAWNKKIPFVEVVLKNKEVTSRLDTKTIIDITDPLKYIGESKKIIKIIAKKYHKTKTL
ncbi:MAG: lyase family protein [Candidatus Diapherotrites archaeon]